MPHTAALAARRSAGQWPRPRSPRRWSQPQALAGRLWTAAGLTLPLLLLWPLSRAFLGLLPRLPAVEALIAVKQQFVDPGQKLESWDATLTNPCGWYHVTCSADALVIRLDLSKTNLSGTLDPSIGMLPQMQYLFLNNNSLHGPLPSELGNLTNLITLEAEDNMFTGPIPASLGWLLGLETL
eukprot:SM003370S12904  [mRNA]  locus=s3370:87:1430:- [translate_table: standard]